jgi:hypothetical protein
MGENYGLSWIFYGISQPQRERERKKANLLSDSGIKAVLKQLVKKVLSCQLFFCETPLQQEAQALGAGKF